MATIGQSLESTPQVSGLPERQQKIVDELGLLIRQFSAGEQTGTRPGSQQSSPGTAQSGTGQGTGQASADATGDDRDSTLIPALPPRQLILKAWGEMPGQIPDQFGNAISPEFLPAYERMIREYYRRMSR